MIGFFNYTVWLTYGSLISAIFGIGFACTDRPEFAIICLLLSGFFDLFDGKVARTKKNRTEREKRFGVQIDSLTDLIAFGVLPAFIGYNIGLDRWYEVIGIAFYCLCGLIRLSFFNVLEEERNYNSDGTPKLDAQPNKEFIGMPITMAALIFPFTFIFKKDLQDNFQYLYLALLILTGLMFVLKIKFKKPKVKGAIILCTIGVAMFVLILLRLLKVF